MTGRPRASRSRDTAGHRALARRRRRRRIRTGIAWALLAVLVGTGTWGATLGRGQVIAWVASHTRLLTVSRVEPGPTRWVAPWELVELTAVSPGDDLLEIDPEVVRARLLTHPRVADARVRKLWTRGIRVDVTERPPLALWLEAGPAEVAADGTVLGPPARSAQPSWPQSGGSSWRPCGVDLPLLTGGNAEGLEPGDTIGDEGARQALGFLALLRYYGRHGEAWLSEVDASRPGDLVAVTLNPGMTVHVGDGQISRRKVDAIRAALDEVQGVTPPVRYLDARFRNQVVVKLDPGKGR